MVLDDKSSQEYPVNAGVPNSLLTFLIMLSVILLSMQMTLLSTVNVMRHLICGSN